MKKLFFLFNVLFLIIGTQSCSTSSDKVAIDKKRILSRLNSISNDLYQNQDYDSGSYFGKRVNYLKEITVSLNNNSSAITEFNNPVRDFCSKYYIESRQEEKYEKLKEELFPIISEPDTLQKNILIKLFEIAMLEDLSRDRASSKIDGEPWIYPMVIKKRDSVYIYWKAFAGTIAGQVLTGTYDYDTHQFTPSRDTHWQFKFNDIGGYYASKIVDGDAKLEGAVKLRRPDAGYDYFPFVFDPKEWKEKLPITTD